MSILLKLNEKMCFPRQFLEFVTACPRLPHGGLAAAEIAVVAAQPKSSLPRAHTCTNELQLPSYETLEELSKKLVEAMENVGIPSQQEEKAT